MIHEILNIMSTIDIFKINKAILYEWDIVWFIVIFFLFVPLTIWITEWYLAVAVWRPHSDNRDMSSIFSIENFLNLFLKIDKVGIMQNSSKFFFRFFSTWLDRARRAEQEYIYFNFFFNIFDEVFFDSLE